jgi:hypothetical protein
MSIGSRIAGSRPVMMISLKRSHDVPRDFSSSCLKFRTSFQSLTTLEMGKKRKQNFEHNISQSHCILSTVRLYHCLAIPANENRNNFHLKVLSDMPAIRKHAQSIQTLVGESMGLCCLLMRRVDPKSFLLDTGAAHS